MAKALFFRPDASYTGCHDNEDWMAQARTTLRFGATDIRYGSGTLGWFARRQ